MGGYRLNQDTFREDRENNSAKQTAKNVAIDQ
jgi:hypothetical protein